MTNKILIIVFIILLLVVVGEVCYFFFYQPCFPIKQKVAVPTQSLTPSASPTLLPKDRQVNPDYIQYLSELKKQNGVDYYLNSLVRGYVGSISTEEFEKNGRKYLGSLTIVDKENDLLEGINFSQKQLDLTKFYKIEADNKKVPISLKDLRQSQAVTFSTIIDLSKDIKNDIFSSEIVVQ